MIRIRKASAKEIRYSCMNYHYAKRVPAISYSFAIFNDDVFCGTILYGPGANCNLGYEYGLHSGEVLELVRVALNGKQGHGHTSEAVAKTLKAIKKANPSVQLIVSYADKDQSHLGVIYQATNWIYTGERECGNVCKLVVNGKEMHPRSVVAKFGSRGLQFIRENIDPNAYEVKTLGKRKYLYPMNKKMRNIVSKLSVPYPKSEE